MLSIELIESVKKHEGFRSQAYQDSVGVWTCGYGTNLQCLEVSRELAEEWLMKDLLRARENLKFYFPVFNTLDKVRQDVLTEMCYNLGLNGISKFKNMWEAIGSANYIAASEAMLASKWATQVGQRANTLAERMRTGQWTKKKQEIPLQADNSKTKNSSLVSAVWAWLRRS